ncbi:UDP-N-acetylglucosamine 1-carboxyvinyltransferase [Bartonella sp. DGB1]|uniref:UDP-N-acetylglucosamine 1-carboxyvinyltransferase n=1 Tax=Bartonella sp. DGB1 TaxID=3239807 RepID=UPI0035241ABD
MDVIKIIGGNQLNGYLPISGAKNAALPLMISSLLTEETLSLKNIPYLADVEQLIKILINHGVHISIEDHENEYQNYSRTIHFTANKITNTTAPYELVSKMRASFWVIAPLLARTGEACVSLPGGCSIGARPLDFIFKGLEALGVEIEIKNGYAMAKASNGLTGAAYKFPKVTVGGTHIMIMAASLANGETILHNAAKEPEIVNLAQCINAMGGNIKGAGTDTVTIQGVTKLHKANIKVISDRIEAGTYAMAVAMTGGDVMLVNGEEKLLPTVIDVLRKTGAEITQYDEGLRVKRTGNIIYPVDIITGVYPEFPTDLQAQFMGLMTKSCGTSRIKETVFENRFMHVPELRRLGANITLDEQEATVTGVKSLTGADVKATDLRASASLVIAALAADGETIIKNIHHLDRGFEFLEKKLSRCGANICRITK